MSPTIYVLSGLLATSIGCSIVSRLSPEELAATMVALTLSAPIPTTEPALTATVVPTNTPIPATATAPATRVPTPTTGPITFVDDFSTPSGSWLDCGQCEWKDGALLMGPFSIEGAYQVHTAICGPCGLVRNYRMSVDVAFVDGQSDRGYGLIVRVTDEYFLVVGMFPWQGIGLWRYDFEDNAWILIDDLVSGYIRSNRTANHLEVTVGPGSTAGRSSVSIEVNGRTLIASFNQPSDMGAVGLTLGGHDLQVVFDNFEFEELPPYEGEPIPASGPPGGTAGLVVTVG